MKTRALSIYFHRKQFLRNLSRCWENVNLIADCAKNCDTITYISGKPFLAITAKVKLVFQSNNVSRPAKELPLRQDETLTGQCCSLSSTRKVSENMNLMLVVKFCLLEDCCENRETESN